MRQTLSKVERPEPPVASLAPVRSEEKEEPFEPGSAGSPDVASALRASHICRLEEDRSEANPSTFHTTEGLFQLQDCNPVF
jgi:hypothetical protein